MSLIEGFEHIVRENEPLAPFTSLRIGGVAEYFAEPTSEEELLALIQRMREADLTVRLIGGGSNVLVRDEGVPGLVVRLSAPAFTDLTVTDNRITAGGGAHLTHWIALAVREGLAGPENLVGIPGTVGGALHHNSGTNGGAIGQWLEEAVVLTRVGERVVRAERDFAFGYRHSSLNELAILSARFRFEREDTQVLTKRMQKLWIVRKSQQPTLSRNPGYVFLDPGGMTASKIIEQCGLKGTSVGRVEVSDRDANFFVAHEGAATEDVQRLIELVRTQVHERTGIELEVGLDIW